MAEITVTRALSELKTLKARFEKSLRDLNLVAVNQGQKLRAPFTSYKKEDFEDKARAGLQSSNALYNRIIALKTAIDQSNSVTKVKICGQELTIQEVLVQKKYLELKHDQLNEFKSQATRMRQDYDSAVQENNSAIEKMVASTIGRDGSEQQKTAARKEAEEYINRTREVSVIDPCAIDGLIKDLEDNISEFENNVDYALSESNSTTVINIPD